METQKEHTERLEKVERSTSSDLLLPEVRGQDIPEDRPGAMDLVTQDANRRYSDSPGSLFQNADFCTLRMRFLRRRKCDPWCECACHKHTRAGTPQMLQSIVGTLFVGYTGLPLLTPSCNSQKCYRTSEGFLQVNYYFPQWFLARIVSVAVRYNETNIRRPDVSVRTLNVRSSYEGIFQSSSRGDADAVKYFLTSGKASVLDVTDDSGHSPLHVRYHSHAVGPIV